MTAGPQEHTLSQISETPGEGPPNGPPARSAWRWLPLAVAGAIALALVERLVNGGWPFWMEDFQVQRLGAQLAVNGDGLYHTAAPNTGLLYTHTPFAALLFVPFVLGAAGIAAMVWCAVEALFLELVIWIMLGAVGVRRAGPRAALTGCAAFAALLLDPIDYDLRLGQLNIMLMLLVLVDFVHGAGRRWHGVGIGLAAGIKLVPLFFILYLLLTRQLRAAITAASVFLATVAAGFVFLPKDSVEYWQGTAADLTRIGLPQLPFNQSLRGVIARLGETSTSLRPIWLVAALLVGVAGLLIAMRLHRAGERLWAVLACAVTATLVSPVSWEHYWVWTVPILIVLAARAVRDRSVASAVLFALLATAFGLRLLHWFVPVDAAIELRLNPLQHLSAAVFPLAGLSILAVLAVIVRRRPHDAPEVGAPPSLA